MEAEEHVICHPKLAEQFWWRREPDSEVCAFCHPLGDDVCRSDHWRVVMSANQNKLGRCLVILTRHVEDGCLLSEAEVTDLWQVVAKVKSALMYCFQPDHMNYAFLNSKDTTPTQRADLCMESSVLNSFTFKEHAPD